ncbi:MULTISPECIES: hypothetical protein [Microbacterium]|jgi:hypothetical protein|uniref:DUF4229 domain-containing protein n=2 Tax=Microbacterium TaxID=33882 RepID=A0ABU1HY68_9MICO|nr:MULTISPECIES: hypothetical protein [Microbacterium]APF33118.1 hypothetical protein BO218_01995 [Microbacterium paludicola]MDQ1215995.1 hypothetical protein [Microbacterium arborescens]MDR6166585.1 hypothetical protein [Microbacterium paludicola]OAZ39452.1 hypothetical protein A9Z40_06280 [Microbacterium arborescens]OWP23071.1 hypothetical protein CBF90_04660 [Microbacterium sp. AISO3]
MNSLLWLTSAATPIPEITVDPTSVTPGPWGFGAIVILTIAVVLLLLDMLRRVRRGRYRAEVREQLDEEDAAARGEQDADTR